MAAPKNDSAAADKAAAEDKKPDAGEPKAEEPKVKKPTKQQGKDGIYFLVNPAGAIHGVDKDHARLRLASPGWRLASEKEIKQYQAQDVQRHNAPIAQPWTPDPDAQLAELPDAYS